MRLSGILKKFIIVARAEIKIRIINMWNFISNFYCAPTIEFLYLEFNIDAYFKNNFNAHAF